MNTLGKKIYLFILAALLFSGCEQINPLEDEQYIKQFYIVGANSIVSSFNVPYKAGTSDAYISIASGGSLNIDKDVTVTVKHDDQAIDWYNNKYMIDAPVRYQILDPSHYEIPSMAVTVKNSEIYGRLPFTVSTQGLHCDSLYAITFAIDAVSEHTKRQAYTVLILNLNLVNDYSGVYQMSINRSVMTLTNGEWVKGVATTLSATRTLKAVNPTTVRFFNEARAEVRSGYASHADYFDAIKKYCVNFTQASDGGFTISPWDGLQILDAGNCTYKDGVFTYWYDYMDGTIRYRIEGTLEK